MNKLDQKKCPFLCRLSKKLKSAASRCGIVLMSSCGNFSDKIMPLAKMLARQTQNAKQLCCANAMKDSPRESSPFVRLREQTAVPDLPHHELALLQRSACGAPIAVKLVRSRDPVTGRSQPASAVASPFHGRTNPNQSDAQDVIQVAAAAGDGDGCQPAGSGWAGLASAGLQHPLPSPEDLDCPHPPVAPEMWALHLLIDSTVVKAERDGEWSAIKYGPSKPRDWRKVHLGIDAEKLEIRAIWKRRTGYRCGSLVEAKMRCLKLLGEHVMPRDFDRQVDELQIRVAILKRFTDLGTPMTLRAG